jgi:hypothetical protein
VKETETGFSLFNLHPRNGKKIRPESLKNNKSLLTKLAG